MQRLEILLGIQQYAYEDSSYKYCFPIFGYHKLGDDGSKLFEYKGTYTNRSTTSFIKKIFSLKHRDSIVCEFFLCMLEAGSKNNELLKYMKLISCEDPQGVANQE